eukprot:1158508-Pelagomonas_calceolata.AAC.41
MADPGPAAASVPVPENAVMMPALKESGSYFRACPGHLRRMRTRGASWISCCGCTGTQPLRTLPTSSRSWAPSLRQVVMGDDAIEWGTFFKTN